MSKGSSPRPFNVSNQEYANRWDAIFGRDNEKTNKTQALAVDRPTQARNIGGGDNRNSIVGQVKDEGIGGT